MRTLKELISNEQTAIIDVRTPAEFMGGHVAGSINIPLNEIPARLDEMKSKGHLVVCCASGGRSMQASMFLKQNGIPCTDGGAWTSVNALKNNN